MTECPIAGDAIDQLCNVASSRSQFCSKTCLDKTLIVSVSD